MITQSSSVSFLLILLFNDGRVALVLHLHLGLVLAGRVLDLRFLFDLVAVIGDLDLIFLDRVLRAHKPRASHSQRQSQTQIHSLTHNDPPTRSSASPAPLCLNPHTRKANL